MHAQQPNRACFTQRVARSAAAAAIAGAMAGAGPADAQLIPASTQFDLTGFLQVANLDPACASNAHTL